MWMQAAPFSPADGWEGHLQTWWEDDAYFLIFQLPPPSVFQAWLHPFVPASGYSVEVRNVIGHIVMFFLMTVKDNVLLKRRSVATKGWVLPSSCLSRYYLLSFSHLYTPSFMSHIWRHLSYAITQRNETDLD